MIALLTPEQVAEQLGVEPKTLANWRSNGTGPVFLKVGKYARYEPAAVEAFLEKLRPKSNVTQLRSRTGRPLTPGAARTP